ncbi:hypothetical protein FGG08_001294 [Glutinoglossum americanum]|uniref:Fido domain-containing protein n=1 Tax=Glutinoglossum americanum TaxID=1670608 RepID=A0A9P8IEZ0_9PEZI|nr:hypothetical protein FGG08_001294 [Glutinoglossum americanum]
MIHPIVDGNGRTCRLILNAILLKYAGVIVAIGEQDEDRKQYIEIQKRAGEQMEGSGELAAFVLKKATTRHAARLYETISRVAIAASDHLNLFVSFLTALTAYIGPYSGLGPAVCSPGGYLDYQGFDISPAQGLVPRLQKLLWAFRDGGFQVYHTREGLQPMSDHSIFHALTLRMIVSPGHRPDLSTLSTRELFRSSNNASGIGIGSTGPLGRLLVRGELGHDIIPELYPLEREPVIDKPGKGAFAHTDFDLLLRIRGIRNLVLAGVTTDVCVSTTMREANDRGYDCLLVKNGTAAVEEVLHAAVCEGVRMEGGIFGVTASVEDVLKTLREEKPVG